MKQYETNKLHYGKYLYKIVLYSPLSYLWQSYKPQSYVDNIFNDLKEQYNSGGPIVYKRWRTAKLIDNVEFESAFKINKILKKFKDRRTRVDYSTLNIYTSDDDIILELQDTVKDAVIEIHRPAEGIETFLTQNIDTAIVKTPPEYDFRVYLKGNPIDPSFANWLEANKDKCRVGQQTLWNIRNSVHYTSGNYFYIKNEKVLTMIRMIIGHNIRKVERLVYKGDIDKYTYADIK